jgi:hypothetical protein
MQIDGNKNKKALLISFHFPPYNEIAAVRIGKFAKYLPDYGWEPIVLTVKDRLGIPKTLPVEVDESTIIRTNYWAIIDPLSRIYGRTNNRKSTIKISGLQQIGTRKKSIILKMIHVFEPLSTLPVLEKLVFDPMGWYKPGVKAGLEIINSNEIKVIFSSFTPSVAHLIAARLHRETGIPWVADYRDDWIGNYKTLPRHLYFLDRQWEKHTLKYCNSIISLDYPLAKILESVHHKIPTLIPNGFDETDFKNNIPLTSRFTITYTGNIYGKRDPSPLFQALSELRLEGILSSDDVEIRFFGQSAYDYMLRIMAKFNVQDFVKLGGIISYKESIEKQMESTVLLLLSWNDLRDVGTLTGKIYEYLGAHRPVLAMAYPGGEIDKLLQKSGCGIVANEPWEIKKILLTWFMEYKRTGTISTYIHPDSDIINNYTRKNQSRDLAEVFNKLSICNEISSG